MALEHLGKERSHESRIWRMLAYAARYGHQPVSVLLYRPISDIRAFNREISSFLGDEARSLNMES